jgi:putative ABC transport system ATP-binding protein
VSCNLLLLIVSLIEVKNLEKTYPDGTRALRGVSFMVEEGEFVAITGLSGSGKSTLLHILGFLDRETKGEYRFRGKAINAYSEDEKAHLRNQSMGFVFQMFNLLPHETVYKNVMLPLFYSNVPIRKREERVMQAIKEVELEHRKDHDATKLSGGERQRVAIARALVLEPSVIFADEPTGNLDSKTGESIMDILWKLNEEKGHTIILITHETYTAAHAKRLIRIHDGEIAEDRMQKETERSHGHFVK